MQYGLCNLSIIPLRLEPSDASEMVNQVLFGESFKIIEQRKKWSKIRLSHDKYEGWLDNKQIQICSEDYYKDLKEENTSICAELIEIISHPRTGAFFPVLLGCYLPFIENGKVSLDKELYDFQGPLIQTKSDRPALIDYAYQYINAPYLWGGRTPMGIDCSGFTQMVYRLSGFSIPRDASQQALLGETLSFIEESEPGDLAFFDNEEGKIVHVGIILSNNYIIHASGKVRLDRLDQTGIFNSEINGHTHKLRVIKKIIP